ncbi:hypothetical protein [Terrarubrum flagellatum]|uniref:hypothetical protein n=1 Tax=Terrirubrum flagellatum TaxID=2895980 RepID=UPI00314565E9
MGDQWKPKIEGIATDAAEKFALLYPAPFDREEFLRVEGELVDAVRSNIGDDDLCLPQSAQLAIENFVRDVFEQRLRELAGAVSSEGHA